MPIAQGDLARVLETLEREGTGHALRFTAAAAAMHGLLAGGHRSVYKPDQLARDAYELGEAFLAETVDRLLPKL